MEDLFERMTKIRPGSLITVNGKNFAVEWVAISRYKSQTWVNIVTHDNTGTEVAIKAAHKGNELTLWRQISLAMGMTSAIRFQEKSYFLWEEKVIKVIGKAGQEIDGEPISRWVARLKSGLQMAVEIRRNGKYYFFVANPSSPEVSF